MASIVIPAQAGIQSWTPAFAGVTFLSRIPASIVTPASIVIPAQAGIQSWTPAFAGVTDGLDRHTGASRYPVLDPGVRRGDVLPPGDILQMKQPCVYLLTSRRNGTLYVGVTSDLIKRVWQHKEDLVEGFTKRYGVHTLVWYEAHPSMESAIRREKAIKEWKRSWKLKLIEKENPEWRDLYEGLHGHSGLDRHTGASRYPVLDPGVRRGDG